MRSKVFLIQDQNIEISHAGEDERKTDGMSYVVSIKQGSFQLDTNQIKKRSPDDDILYSKIQELLNLDKCRKMELNCYKLNFEIDRRPPCTFDIKIDGLSWTKRLKLESGLMLKVQLVGTGNRVSNEIKWSAPLMLDRNGCISKKDVTIPATWSSVWINRDKQFAAVVSIQIVSDIPVLGPKNNYQVQWFGMDPFTVNKVLLNKSVATDVKIISAGGCMHRCHKSFLIAQSEVFAPMFQHKWKEATEGVIDMSDITKDGVEGVLAYLYYMDLEKPNANLEIAHEMLLFANKYGIQSLEKDLTKLILCKPTEWFEVKATFQLYLTLQRIKLPFSIELGGKTVQMLKASCDELIILPEYKKLMMICLETYFALSNTLITLESGNCNMGAKPTNMLSSVLYRSIVWLSSWFVSEK